MKVDKDKLIKLIELLVRKQVKSEVKLAVNEAVRRQNVLSDIKNPVPSLSQAIDEPVSSTVEQKAAGSNPLMEALQETAQSGEWKNMGASAPGAPQPAAAANKPYDTSRMGEILNNQYSDMGAVAPVDVAADTAAKANVNAEALPDGLKNALNKNYSELVKRF